jgi:hypothetical protein
VIRNRILALVLLAAGLVLAGAGEALAAADVHKFNLVLSANPTQIKGGDFTDNLDWFNDNVLEPKGLSGFDRITYGWYYESSLQYFVKSNFALNVGVGQIRQTTKKEYLPALRQDIQIRFEVLSVPAHLGGSYYFTPYNQGDFQARAYFGGGILSNLDTKITYQQYEVNTDSVTTLRTPFTPEGGSTVVHVSRNNPGWYIEGGVHMFFASRFSVMLGGFYHSSVSTELRITEDGTPVNNLTDEDPASIDMGGVGVRLGLAIGL